MHLSSPLLFINCRRDCRKAAGPHLPTSLGKQQRSAQHRQHAEHALLQQQHGLACPAHRQGQDREGAHTWVQIPDSGG